MDGTVLALITIAFAIFYSYEKDPQFKLLWIVAGGVTALAAFIYDASLCTTNTLTQLNGTITTTYSYCTTSFNTGSIITWFLVVVAAGIILTIIVRYILELVKTLGKG